MILSSGSLYVQSNRPAVYFNGVAGTLLENTSYSLPTSTPVSFTAVVNPSSSNNSFAGLIGSNGGNGIMYFAPWLMDGSGTGPSTTANVTPNDNTTQLLTGIYTTSTTQNSYIFKNGTLGEYYTGGGNVRAGTGIQIGGRTGGGIPERVLRGFIQEAIAYTESILTNRQPIEQNTNQYFNIYTPEAYNLNTNSLSLFSNASTVAGAANSVASASFTTGGPLGLITVTRTGSSDYALWKNKVPNRVTLPASLPQTSSFFLNAANVNNLVFSSSQNNVAYASVGAGLTDSETRTYYDLVDAFQTNLGRKNFNTGSFITLWDTRLTGSGTSNSSSIVLPLFGTQAITASWGDGTTSNISSSTQVDRTHSYATPGVYTVTITGTGQGFRFNNGGDRTKLIDVVQFGNAPLATDSVFYGCDNLIITSRDRPTITSTSPTNTFRAISRIKAYVNDWDVSNVTDLTWFFGGTNFNEPLNNWRPVSCSSFAATFYVNGTFNQDIGSWPMSNATNLGEMFNGGASFNNGGSDSIKNWDVSKVTSFYYTFRGTSLNQPIGSWRLNTGSNVSMQYAFGGTPLNQDLGSWNVTKVTDMSAMFNGSSFNNSGSNSINNWRPISCSTFAGMFQACPFNQPIGNWPLSASNINMSQMFYSAGAFNQNIGTWDVTKVTNMSAMFYGSSFNNSGSSDINNWRPISCSNFSSMFQQSSFNQSIANWPLSASNIDMGAMFRGSGYNSNIGALNVSNVTSFATIFQQSSFNNSGSTSINNWQINTGSNVSFFQMFYQCPFNQPIGSWNVSKVTNMFSMFENNSAFNQSLENWTPVSCSNFSRMFYRSAAFNGSVLNWTLPTSTGFTMDLMFSGINTTDSCKLNQNLSNWNVTKATNMSGMFRFNTSFNNSGSAGINSWTPVSCSNFSDMFLSASAFNQPVEGWTLPTDRTFNMSNMFARATSFNQPLGNWTIISCSNMTGMLDNCGMDKGFYSSTLIGWASQAPNIKSNVTLGATGRQYDTPGSASRSILTSAPYNWTITGDTFVP